MKKSLYTSFFVIPILILFSFAKCKKENTPSTITLYNKPLGTIQSYIQGRWKCHYGKGGIAANMVQYYNNYYWTFTFDNKIEVSNNGNIIADTTIKWVKALGTFTNGDSTFTINFYDKRGYPSGYVIDGIFNDTLILHGYSSDAVFYHFTKSN